MKHRYYSSSTELVSVNQPLSHHSIQIVWSHVEKEHGQEKTVARAEFWVFGDFYVASGFAQVFESAALMEKALDNTYI